VKSPLIEIQYVVIDVLLSRSPYGTNSVGRGREEKRSYGRGKSGTKITK